jgi:enoyl-CoA hydratase/carnithine racemase
MSPPRSRKCAIPCAVSDSLVQDLDAGVLHLTLNRPHKKNALDAELFSAVGRALEPARENDRVNVVLLSGAGGNFCSGMDLTAAFGEEGSKPFDYCAAAVVAFDKPLVAAVDGVAIGGGATIPFHCDIVYVAKSLRMRLPFVSLGLVPEFASSYMLQANIGARRAAELMYTAEWIDADRAYEVGIATRVFEDSELHGRAMEKAREIAQWPVNSLRETKRTLRLAHQVGIAGAIEAESKAMLRQAGSPENIEAVRAFIEKRPPNFRDL